MPCRRPLPYLLISPFRESTLLCMTSNRSDHWFRIPYSTAWSEKVGLAQDLLMYFGQQKPEEPATDGVSRRDALSSIWVCVSLELRANAFVLEYYLLSVCRSSEAGILKHHLCQVALLHFRIGHVDVLQKYVYSNSKKLSMAAEAVGEVPVLYAVWKSRSRRSSSVSRRML